MEVTESAFLKTALLCGNGSEACVTKWERLAGSRIWRRPVWISIVSDVTAPGATCPTPASVEHADIQVKSYHLHSRERYVCNSGFKRKAGTSSLTECVFNKATNMTHWTTPNLKCISALPDSSRYATVIISTSVPGILVMCLVSVLLVYYIKSRNTSHPPAAGMEPMEAMPMTGGTGSREADRRNCPLNL